MKFANINITRSNVIATAKDLFFSALVADWATAMKTAWAFVKFKEAVKQGLPVSFTKVDGSKRTVQAPAMYQSTSNSTSGKKSPKHLFVFLDTQKEGNNVISCDITRLV